MWIGGLEPAKMRPRASRTCGSRRGWLFFRRGRSLLRFEKRGKLVQSVEQRLAPSSFREFDPDSPRLKPPANTTASRVVELSCALRTRSEKGAIAFTPDLRILIY